MNQFKSLLAMFGDAPDTQLDKSQSVKFKKMAEYDTNPTPDEIKEILDECAYASLASGFAMVAMNTLWEQLKKLDKESGLS